MRKLLDGVYTGSGLLSAGLIAAICLLVTAQVLLNLITKYGPFAFNMTIPSYADFAGYMLAASTFLALAYTLMRGGHIRVTMILNTVPSAWRLLAELFCLAVCAAVAGLASFYMYRLVHESWEFGDMSSGIIAIPLFIPQSAVLAGLVILTMALVDLTVQTARAGRPVIEQMNTE
ncbi:TRAP transporter small permease [Hoeflea sp. YIM 152468]|uniref:TRAP transporter small permease n=1 Tax=Hoeflea sp. YIM 152468 TaxID=3031759 RepID=UPI0023DBC7FA|nr:TRAP transporter small permease [Hoeflea sp. YIM 152468]MDF1609592.1 TRAP transporter small permease [Hoeflea sp. YIM 152468]